MHFISEVHFFCLKFMRCQEIFTYIEDWAPKEIAWDKDNVGLQIGSAERVVTNILLSLEVNENVVEEAIKKKCNLVITHHPLLFQPLKKIDTAQDKTSILIEKLIKQNITLYSAHTNLDFIKDGVSFQLAKQLQLEKISFLKNLSELNYKLSVFVPISHIDAVSDAIFNAGGGKFGEYSHCGFRTIGTGSFKGSEYSNPAIGKKQNLEFVDEVKFEVMINSFDVNKVLKAMFEAHPYEVVAYDIYPLKNQNVNYGIGAIGELNTELNEKDFLRHISEKLKIKNFRYTKGTKRRIKKVAVCGGSGSDVLQSAINANADAFITADIKYHAFQDAQNEILLVDAGHYETEIHSLNEIQKRLSAFISKSKSKILKYTGTTNPVVFYNN